MLINLVVECTLDNSSHVNLYRLAGGTFLTRHVGQSTGIVFATEHEAREHIAACERAITVDCDKWGSE